MAARKTIIRKKRSRKPTQENVDFEEEVDEIEEVEEEEILTPTHHVRRKEGNGGGKGVPLSFSGFTIPRLATIMDLHPFSAYTVSAALVDAANGRPEREEQEMAHKMGAWTKLQLYKRALKLGIIQ